MSRPLRILVVEDEMTIALLIEDMLVDLGHDVVGLAMRLPQATEMARALDLDLAILDINLDGRKSFPVAEVLLERGIPLLFASGYGSPGLEPPFEGQRVLQKPFEVQELKGAIAQVAA
jgi:CheY-like chemotaxis protein